MNWNELLDKALDTLRGWASAAAELAPNLAVAIVVLVIAYIVARIVGSVVEKSMARISDNAQATGLVAQLVRFGVMVAGLFAALGIMQLDGTVKSLLAGVGVIGLALGFAFQDIAANFVSGVMLAFKRQFDRGDLIEVAGFFGIVEDVNLRVTIGRTFQGQRVIIPNKEIFNSKITNFYANDERRVDLEVGVSYGDDLEKAKSIALEAVSGVEERDGDRDPDLYYTGFGASSIDFVVRFWIKPRQKNFLAARSNAIIAIKKAFDSNDITIPFPIRTLDFGIPGGVAIGEALPQLGRKPEPNGERSGSGDGRVA